MLKIVKSLFVLLMFFEYCVDVFGICVLGKFDVKDVRASEVNVYFIIGK